MKRVKPILTKLPWAPSPISPATLALARVTAVSLSYQNGSVTFDEVREALAADDLVSPPAAIVFVPSMFEPVGIVAGQAAFRAV